MITYQFLFAMQALLPARIPLSLFLTPKVARVLSRVFR